MRMAVGPESLALPEFAQRWVYPGLQQQGLIHNQPLIQGR